MCSSLSYPGLPTTLLTQFYREKPDTKILSDLPLSSVNVRSQDSNLESRNLNSMPFSCCFPTNHFIRMLTTYQKHPPSCSMQGDLCTSDRSRWNLQFVEWARKTSALSRCQSWNKQQEGVCLPAPNICKQMLLALHWERPWKRKGNLPATAALLSVVQGPVPVCDYGSTEVERRCLEKHMTIWLSSRSCLLCLIKIRGDHILYGIAFLFHFSAHFYCIYEKHWSTTD